MSVSAMTLAERVTAAVARVNAALATTRNPQTLLLTRRYTCQRFRLTLPPMTAGDEVMFYEEMRADLEQLCDRVRMLPTGAEGDPVYKALPSRLRPLPHDWWCGPAWVPLVAGRGRHDGSVSCALRTEHGALADGTAAAAPALRWRAPWRPSRRWRGGRPAGKTVALDTVFTEPSRMGQRLTALLQQLSPGIRHPGCDSYQAHVVSVSVRAAQRHHRTLAGVGRSG